MPKVKINIQNFKQITTTSNFGVMPWRSWNRLTAFLKRKGQQSCSLLDAGLMQAITSIVLTPSIAS
jgi:hypothetical protein